MVQAAIGNTKGFVKKYSAATLRLSIYIILAVLATVQSEIAGLTAFSDMTGISWFRLFVAATIAGLTVWRAFIDKTMARVEDAGKSPDQAETSTQQALSD